MRQSNLHDRQAAQGTAAEAAVSVPDRGKPGIAVARPCCTPQRCEPSTSLPALPETWTAGAADATDVAMRMRIPGGKARVGTNRPVILDDGEGPERLVTVAAFDMDAHAVTNARFARFVDATGHVTDAERFGWSFVFHLLLRDAASASQGVAGAPWWRRVEGACWSAPEGEGSDVSGRGDHPVVHVSWADACAFAAWAGGRLPTEAEWEHAAAGGRSGAPYPWGQREPDDDTFQPCNIWQGRFPNENTSRDGWLGTAPADAYEPNGYGLYNMCGNVWEWCADPFRIRSLKRTAIMRNAEAEAAGSRLMKGGSYLCHASYCHRYRIAARLGATPDTSTGHTGLRLVYDVPGRDGSFDRG